MSELKKYQQEIEKIMNDRTLTFWQRVDVLAKYAENLLDYPEGTPEEFYILDESREISDLHEGHGPIGPRYILPDYAKFMKEGSKFLRLDPPENLLEAVNSLLIFYRNAHSVTRFPVYLGRIDKLLEEFVIKEDYDKA